MKDLADLEAPADWAKPLLEAEIQKRCVEWARNRGYWARKFSSISQRSVPDYLFARSKGAVKIKFACEFKREDAKVKKETGCLSTVDQIREQEAMRSAGWYVFECYEVDHFKRIVLAYEAECV